MLSEETREKEMKLGVDTAWLNSKNTFEFFTGYCNWSEDLRHNPLSAKDLHNLFYKVDEFKYSARSKAVFKYKLLLESSKIDDDPLLEEYFQYFDKLTENGFWLEGAFDISRRLRQNSFIAPQGFPSFSGEHQNLTSKINRDVNLQRSENSVRNIFEKISKLTRGATKFSAPLLELKNRGSSLFQAISQIHFEVTDNLDHWLYYPKNKRCLIHNRHLFGDTLLLEVKTISMVSGLVGNQSKSDKIDNFFKAYPDAFGSYAKAYRFRQLERSKSRYSKTEGMMFLEISYYDNGRGIIENLSNFSTVGVTNLKDVVLNSISSRPFANSGRGFKNIVKHTKSKNGIFFMQSGNELITSDPYINEELSMQNIKNFVHGTIITILIPVS